MTALIVDASALYAQADAAEPAHGAVARLIQGESGELVTSELAVAEADYLILKRLGVDVELAFIEDLAAATYTVECLSRAELEEAWRLVGRYRDLRIGLADASLILLAHRFRTSRVLTLDERAFRTVAPLSGGAFTILPADAL